MIRNHTKTDNPACHRENAGKPETLQAAGRAHCVWITRGGTWALDMANMLEGLGITSFVYPVIDCVPTQECRKKLQEIPLFDWLVITSATTVDILSSGPSSRSAVRQGSVLTLSNASESWPVPGSVKIAAIGRETRKALEQAGYQVSLCPKSDFSSEGLVSAFLDYSENQRHYADHCRGRQTDHWAYQYREQYAGPGTGHTQPQRILILTSNIAEVTLKNALETMGYIVTVSAVYETVILKVDPEKLPDNITAAFVTSGSIARGIARAGCFDLELVCIGQKTADICRDLGLRVGAIAKTKDKNGLARALLEVRLN